MKSLNRPVEALECFSQALLINPTVAETWNNRGTIHNIIKRYDDAIIDFNKAISLQPNFSAAYFNKGKSLAVLKRYDEAFAAYDKALALKPDLKTLGLVVAMYSMSSSDTTKPLRLMIRR